MEWISVSTARTNGEALVVQLLFEFCEFLAVFPHGQLAMRIAGVVSGTKFDRRNVESFELLKNLIKGKLRQQRGKTSNSHERQGITAKGLGS